MNAVLIVPKGTIEKYKATEGWKDFTNIQEGVPTSIEKVLSSQSNVQTGKFYNLHGQQIDTPTKGLYIVNGKKVMIK